MRTLMILLLMAASIKSHAQVSIGKPVPDKSAILELYGTNGGMLFSRMTNAQVNAITNPAVGLMVWNIDSTCLMVYKDTNYSNGGWNCLQRSGVPLPPNPTPDTAYIRTKSAQCGNVVVAIAVTNGGSGYSSAPKVSIGLPPQPPTCKGCVSAAAYATINAGVVDSIIITQSGSGFTTGVPSVTLTGGGGTGATAIAFISHAVCKRTYCSDVAGATRNDDTLTTGGVEFDWSGAVPSVYTATRALVQIGSQCWMRYNIIDTPDITTNNWPIGTSPELTGYGNTTQWPITGLAGKGNIYYMDSTYHGYYNNTVDDGSQSWYKEPPSANQVNGRLFQWSAAMEGDTMEKAQGVCPTGFHIATDCEWMVLESQLGFDSLSLDTFQDGKYRGGANGLKIKARPYASGWANDSVNLTGFNLWETGRRRPEGYFSSYGGNGTNSNSGSGWIWTSTHDFENSRWTAAVRRGVRDGNTYIGILRTSENRGFGYQVRCIKN